MGLRAGQGAAGFALVLALGACSGSGTAGGQGLAARSPADAAPSSSPTPSRAAPPSPPSPSSSGPTRTRTPSPRPSGDPDFGARQQLATGLRIPWGLAFLPGGDALIAERDSARILRLTPGRDPRPVYQVPGVEAAGEGGLLGLAVSPSYARDHWVYAYYTAAGDNRIVRFRLGNDAEPQLLLDGISKATYHDGGRLAFGPDGMLYVTTGDAGNTAEAQDREDLNGKVLRLTPAAQVPADNPFPGSPVYSWGHRNVQGLAWDDEGRLYASEFGQNSWDEVNRIEAGRNYGWPENEGRGDTRGGTFVNPQVQWRTSEASPSGAAVVGNRLYVAALRGERIWQLQITADGDLGEQRPLLTGELGRIRTLAVAPDGSLWFTTSNTDGRGDVREGDDRLFRVPLR